MDVLAANSEGENILRERFMTDGSDKRVNGVRFYRCRPRLGLGYRNTYPDYVDGGANVGDVNSKLEQGKNETMDKPPFWLYC